MSREHPKFSSLDVVSLELVARPFHKRVEGPESPIFETWIHWAWFEPMPEWPERAEFDNRVYYLHEFDNDRTEPWARYSINPLPKHTSEDIAEQLEKLKGLQRRTE